MVIVGPCSIVLACMRGQALVLSSMVLVLLAIGPGAVDIYTKEMAVFR